jgi:hypothetical protein
MNALVFEHRAQFWILRFFTKLLADKLFWTIWNCPLFFPEKSFRIFWKVWQGPFFGDYPLKSILTSERTYPLTSVNDHPQLIHWKLFIGPKLSNWRFSLCSGNLEWCHESFLRHPATVPFLQIEEFVKFHDLNIRYHLCSEDWESSDNFFRKFGKMAQNWGIFWKIEELKRSTKMAKIKPFSEFVWKSWFQIIPWMHWYLKNGANLNFTVFYKTIGR